ncbi:MAG: TIGR02466 family protein [Novosphingobium sp.]
MSSEPDRFDLFPTRVWVFQLGELASLFDQWVTAVHAWRASDASLGSSNRGGWTSSRTVLDRPEFEELGREVRRCFDAAWAEIAPVPRPGYKLRGWVNLQEPGGFNHFHTHGRAALAGVFYLSAPAGGGDIIFRDPRAGINLAGIKGDGVNCFSVTSHTPAVGEFVVFPGWLEHGVDVNAASATRISIAINCYCDDAQIA